MPQLRAGPFPVEWVGGESGLRWRAQESALEAGRAVAGGVSSMAYPGRRAACKMLPIWADIFGRSAYCVQQAPATPRYASGPWVRSAAVAASVSIYGSQRTPRASAVSTGLLRYGFWKWRGRKGSIPTGVSRQGQAERGETHDDIDGAEPHTLG